MKTHIAGLLMVYAFASLQAQNNVGIGTNSPDPSAKLEVVSGSQGVLIPRMTQSQMNAIAAPAEGLLVYQTTPDTGFFFHRPAGWNKLNDDLGNHTAQQSLDMNNHSVTNVPAPVNSQDAANKAYVDARIAQVSQSPGGCCTPPNISSESSFTMTMGSAMLYCDTLTESNYTDWHLPSDDELTLAASGTAIVPGIRTNNWLWTRSHAAGTWYVIRLGDGEVSYQGAANLNKARCVR